MLKLLVKKQMTEIFRGFFYNAKKNKAQPKARMILLIALYFLLMFGVIGGMVTMLCISICKPMAALNVGWLYFLILGLMAILLGTLGSVFSTFSGLYLAKDNDLLFSLPIPPRTVMTARLVTVFLMSLFFTIVVSCPAVIVYWCIARVTVMTVIGGLLWILLIALFVMSLSSALGWVVARISVHLKHKSVVTALIAVAGLALYYYLYFKAQDLVRKLVENAVFYGEKIKGTAYALYVFGRSAEGGWWELLTVTAVVLALLALCLWLLARSFLKIATMTTAAPRATYRETTAKQRTPFRALVVKERSRLLSSPTYLLNCTLGLLFIPAIGIFLLIKGKEFIPMIEALLSARKGAVAVIFCTATMTCLTMIDTAAPSVSLEGKSLWIAKSLPVQPWKILRAKLLLQLRLSQLPILFSSVVAAVLISGSPALKVLIVIVSLLNAHLFSLFCLYTGVRFANCNWTNEMIPVKQGAAVAFAMLGGFCFAALMCGLYFLTAWRIGAVGYLGLCMVVEIALCFFFYLLLKKIGVERFEEL